MKRLVTVTAMAALAAGLLLNPLATAEAGKGGNKGVGKGVGRVQKGTTNGSHRLPPGLEKRHTLPHGLAERGELPPGLAKDHDEPRGLAKRETPPPGLSRHPGEH